MSDSFHNLNIWKKGYSLILEIDVLLNKFPIIERKILVA